MHTIYGFLCMHLLVLDVVSSKYKVCVIIIIKLMNLSRKYLSSLYILSPLKELCLTKLNKPFC
jgi:hypothetical protein